MQIGTSCVASIGSHLITNSFCIFFKQSFMWLSAAWLSLYEGCKQSTLTWTFSCASSPGPYIVDDRGVIWGNINEVIRSCSQLPLPVLVLLQICTCKSLMPTPIVSPLPWQYLLPAVVFHVEIWYRLLIKQAATIPNLAELSFNSWAHG